MTFLQNNTDFYYEVAAGRIAGKTVVHKFGRNAAVGTSFEPIAHGGVYETPQVAGATALRIKAGGNANDTAAGAGAREVTLVGLDETGAEVSEAIATAGASASSATTTTFMRLFKLYVSSSGSYASSTSGSHAQSIVIENGAGGTDWATISSTNFARSRSQIGAYTVPLGQNALVDGIIITVESTKLVNIIMFKRASILETAAPYAGTMQALFEATGVEGTFTIPLKSPIALSELTDIGFMARVTSGTADVTVDYIINQEDN